MKAQQRHETDDSTLEHLMNVAGVHPYHQDWRKTWSETTREKVAVWSAFVGINRPDEAGEMPHVLVRCPFAEKVRKMGVNLA